MNRPPAFQFYVKDWLTSKKRVAMALDQQAAYINLLCHCWDTDDCSLPDDPAILAALSELREHWNTRSTPVQQAFVPHPKKPGFLTNMRLYEEHQKYLQIQKERRRAGRESGASRRKYKTNNNEQVFNKSSSLVEQMGNSSSSSSSSLSLHPKKDSEKEETTLSRSSRDFMQEAREVLQFLNLKSGRQFREVDSTLQMIAARLKGQSEKTAVDIQACKSLIAKKVREWGSDEKMAKYLRPETLFNRTKFESYLGEVSTCTAQTVTASSAGTLRPVPAGGEPKRCSPPAPTGSSSNAPSLVAL